MFIKLLAATAAGRVRSCCMLGWSAALVFAAAGAPRRASGCWTAAASVARRAAAQRGARWWAPSASSRRWRWCRCRRLRDPAGAAAGGDAGGGAVSGRTVGWRRWTAICVGFAGVLSDPAARRHGRVRPRRRCAVHGGGRPWRCAIWRRGRTPVGITTLQLAFWGYATADRLRGVVLVAAAGRALGLAGRAAAGLMLAVAQVLRHHRSTRRSPLALRIGEASVVAPFRYSRLVFALALGVRASLARRPDALMLLGLR